MVEKILIVDDDVDSLKLIGLMLKRHNYEVVVADAGQKALAKAEAEIPDLIILDVMMPDMNGLEVTRRLRASEKTKNIPIIMFTAKTLINDKIIAFEAGADDYLTKPTHPAELASRVKAILARKATVKKGNAQTSQASMKKGLTLGIMGAKGGVGVTTLAINMSAALMKAGEQAVIADFQLGNGSIGRMLGTSSQGMSRVLTTKKVDAATVEKEILVHQSGLRGLLSSSSPKEILLSNAVDKAVAALEMLRDMGHPVVVDIGAGLTPLNIQLIQHIDKLMFVVEANSVALDIANDYLSDIDELIGGNHVNVVVINRSQSTLSWHDVENILKREVKAIISAAPELAHQALENRQPMVLMQPNAMVSGQFIKLAEEMKRIRSIENA
ncbi:MAG: response regulator [Anaerolineae bacterium]|nr:response regulator [Anaerolineae bacterium]MDQ7034418.1 response regulator [Anaerolineae bacterium]